jgi:hypothetical protein
MAYQIMETNNYSKFVLTDFNRDVRNAYKLRASMMKYGFIPAYAIHVTKELDGKLRIKEGHHRFRVAMELGLPIYYIICNYEASIQETAESTRPWDLKDYLISWARLGKEAYVAVKEYWEETCIPLNHCIAMLGGHSASSDGFRHLFKKGRYRLGDPSHAAIVKDLVLHCKKHGIKWAANCLFVQALSRIAWAEGFDPFILKRRISANHNLMEKKACMKDYVIMLDEIYNYKSRVKIPLAFNAEKAARERNVINQNHRSSCETKKGSRLPSQQVNRRSRSENLRGNRGANGLH